MTAPALVRLRTLDDIRTTQIVLSTADPAWDRPLVAELIARGIDLATCCSQCRRRLLAHEGPLTIGASLPGRPRLLYGDRSCADASALLPGDAHDGGWVRDETAEQVAA